MDPLPNPAETKAFLAQAQSLSQIFPPEAILAATQLYLAVQSIWIRRCYLNFLKTLAEEAQRAQK